MSGYGKSPSNACIKCGDGLWDGGTKECKIDCSAIPNCLECNPVESELHCTVCDKSYNIGDNGLSCILKTCFDGNPACTECNESDPTVCAKCRDGFVLNEISKMCSCKEGSGFIFDNNFNCFNATCNAQIENCMGACRNGNECYMCNNGFVPQNGACVAIDCASRITNCKECVVGLNNAYYCTTCDNTFIPNSDYTSCVSDTEVECSLTGCLACKNGNTDKCSKCDEKNNFKLVDGRCICAAGFEPVGDQCLEPIPPILPIEIKKDVVAEGQYDINAEDKSFKLKENLNKTTYFSIPENLLETVDVVEIPSGYENVEIKVPGSKEITIQSTNSQLSLDCKDTANLVIPQNSQNINITGYGTVDLKPSESGSKEINLQKVLPEQGQDLLLKSDEADINIKEIQVFGYSSIQGQSDGKVTSCDRVDLEGGSDFYPRYLNLKEVRIGLLSVFNMNNPNITFKDNSDIQVFYNRTLGYKYKSHFPIMISNTLPTKEQLRNLRINVKRINSNETLQEDPIEEFNIARIEEGKNANHEEAYQECLDLKERYDGGESFYDSTCYNDTDSETKAVNLVARKSAPRNPPKDDGGGGLSAGAIAGIVIACVVVVAAIIALLVYFLVIKKRNESTTSTQGDSSIAI